MTDLTIRPATEDDLPAVLATDEQAFNFRYGEEQSADAFTLLPPERFVVADEAGTGIVGITAAYDMAMTLPGGAAVTAPGVTWVAVAPTHRRRGILRQLMAAQHRGFVDAGLGLAMLTASHASIYGRFGYGEATRNRWVKIDPRFAAFRPGAPDPGGVRFASTADVGPHAAEVHRRWAARTPAAVSRSEGWWSRVLADHEYQRHGASALFHLVHADGWANYRSEWDSDGGSLRVQVFAATSDAHAALWRVLLAQELVTSITARLPSDDPLPHLLTDPRLVTTTAVNDGLWVRVLDLPAVLAARRYAVEIDTVLDVRDGFLDRGGRVRLRGGPDGAECTPTPDAPDAHLDIADLGSLVTGCHRARTLAAAGRLTAEHAALARLDAAFIPEREPVHGTDF